MKKQKFPAIIPKGSAIRITQGFTSEKIDPFAHTAVDFIAWDYSRSAVDNQLVTFGSIFAMERDVKVVATDYNGFMNEVGNGVRVEWQEDGYYYQVLFYHTVTNEAKVGQIVKAGETIGRMGNAGYVLPKVTPNAPLNGGHCHLVLQRMKRNQWGNYEIEFLNPLDYFDVNNPVGYTDEGIVTKEDGEPFKWAFEKLGITSAFEKLMYLLSRYKIDR
jgi:hypothetical protein